MNQKIIAVPTALIIPIVIFLLTAIAAPSVLATNVSFLPHVRATIVRALEDEDLTLSGRNDAQFMRYNALGTVELFQCPSIAAFNFHPFHSSDGGEITVGECTKDSLFNESMAEQQARGFEAAISAAGESIGAARQALVDTTKQQVIHEKGIIYVHLTQWLLSGVGSAGGHGARVVETLLMIPPVGKTVILVQGRLSSNACAPSMSLPLCKDFRGAIREVARQVHTAQASGAPYVAFRLEPLRPGSPTICDSLAWTVAVALEQSDSKQVPVTETVRYKQLADQSDVQDAILAAAKEHVQGADITTVATNVGNACFRKFFQN